MSASKCWLQHVAISVADLDESAAWYQEMFGFRTISEAYAPPCKSRIVTMSNGSIELELFLHDETQPLADVLKDPDTAPMVQGVAHFCFGTDDIEGLVAELKAKGVKVLVGPATMGSHTIYYIQDNSGNPVELMQ